MRRYVFHLAILALAVLGQSAVRGDDQQIAQQILQKLQSEKQAGTLKGFSIDLQVDEGTVWLSGRVANEQQQAKALDLARRVPGVQQVVNDLSVAPPPSKSTGKPGIVMTPPPAMAAALPPPTSAAVPGMAMANPYVTNNASQTAAPASEQVAGGPTPAKATRSASSPANSSVLNTISKTLVSAVHGGREVEEAKPVQPVSVSHDVATAIGSSPIGSGVDPSASSRRSVVQAAQPVANVPQVATADSLQPVAAAAPQMGMMPMQMPYMVPVYAGSQMQVPLAMGPARPVNYTSMGGGGPVPPGAAGAPVPMYMPGSGVGMAPARYDHPTMPGYAWPSYAAYPNYAAVTYPKQYSPTAWPYIGPFYPYPQVPLGWRKVTLEWDDGWWMLDFKDRRTMYNH
jgi:BON domain-containing protein